VPRGRPRTHRDADVQRGAHRIVLADRGDPSHCGRLDPPAARPLVPVEVVLHGGRRPHHVRPQGERPSRGRRLQWGRLAGCAGCGRWRRAVTPGCVLSRGRPMHRGRQFELLHRVSGSAARHALPGRAVGGNEGSRARRDGAGRGLMHRAGRLRRSRLSESRRTLRRAAGSRPVVDRPGGVAWRTKNCRQRDHLQRDSPLGRLSQERFMRGPSAIASARHSASSSGAATRRCCRSPLPSSRR
jgi:hypothetical protein